MTYMESRGVSWDTIFANMLMYECCVLPRAVYIYALYTFYSKCTVLEVNELWSVIHLVCHFMGYIFTTDRLIAIY